MLNKRFFVKHSALNDLKKFESQIVYFQQLNNFMT